MSFSTPHWSINWPLEWPLERINGLLKLVGLGTNGYISQSKIKKLQSFVYGGSLFSLFCDNDPILHNVNVFTLKAKLSYTLQTSRVPRYSFIIRTAALEKRIRTGSGVVGGI